MNITIEVLRALSIDFPSEEQKKDIELKSKAISLYMKNAGVNEKLLASDLGTECIIIGVTDIWNLNAGELKFSPAFNIILEQLKVLSLSE